MMSRSHFLSSPVSHAAGLLLAVGLAAPALAVTRSVPEQYPTIQAAINAAAPGDVVVVSPGTYSGVGNRDLSLLGKAITVRSAQGPGTCVINAGGIPNEPHCGFLLQNNEPSTAVIEGFTITGGYQFNGGGIYVGTGSPTIRNCVITGNAVGCWGGGLYYEFNASPRVYNCMIVNNSSTDEGGGVFGIGSGYIESCVIADNTAATGGGICVFGGQSKFVNCRITGNTTTNSGGGAYLWTGSMVNCTVANNSATWQGSGVYMSSGATIVNSIVWGNSGPGQVYNSQSGQPGVTYSIVQGGYTGAGNSALDPRFVNAANGDYRVLDGSPAINTGANQAVPAGVVTDLAGAPRIANHKGGGAGVVDKGAFERPVMVLQTLPAR